jgi:hypothetical protein
VSHPLDSANSQFHSQVYSQWHSQWPRALAEVFLSGTLVGAPRELLQISKDLGVIHLLVLSGTQVKFFNSFSRVFWTGILKKVLGWDERSVRIFLAIFLVLWVGTFQFPPPLTRALLWELALFYSKDFRTEVLAGVLFVVQVLLFPEHLQEIGLYLSWACFLILVFLGNLGLKSWVAQVVTTLFCTILFRLVKGGEWPTVLGWISIIVANLTLGWIAEHLWFPVLGAFQFFAFLGLSLGLINRAQSQGLGVEVMTRLIAPFLLPLIP